MNSFGEHENQLKLYQQQIEDRLEDVLRGDYNKLYANLIDAMKYATLRGGKRIRGILVLAFARLYSGDNYPALERVALDFACAVEMLHAYTLVHDDLPCMDNSDLRRGKPSVHKKFGEATAVLAGDGLLTLAFDLMSRSNSLPAVRQVDAIQILAQASGYYGVVGGQMIDIENEGKAIDYETLQQLHKLKTGALIRASVLIGATVSPLSIIDYKEQVSLFGEILGLSYQIIDDILDTTSTESLLGKPIGSDEKNLKTTYVTLFGEEKSREFVGKKTEEAIAILVSINREVDFLVWLTNYLLKRKF